MPKSFKIIITSVISSILFGLLIFKALNIFAPSNSGSWKKVLTSVELNEDISLLISTFEKGYAGKNILKQEFPQLISGLQNILKDNPEGLDDYTLLKKFQDLLIQVPDGHLAASIDAPSCYLVNRRNLSTPEKNKTASDYKFENISLKRKNILKLSLPTFLIEEPLVIDELIETLAVKIKSADALILDLRGNTGGYQPIPLRIGAILWGEPYREDQRIQFYPTPFEMTYLIRNKVSYNLLWNFFKTADLQPEFQRQMSSIYGVTPISPQEEDFSAAATEDWNTFVDDEPHLKEKGFIRPIYLLVDSTCASACEVMLEALEKHPNKKVIGQQTRGAVQFGGIGTLTLPHSRINFAIAISHVKYFDNRKIERIGYTPNVLIGEGDDSLKIAISTIENDLIP